MRKNILKSAIFGKGGAVRTGVDRTNLGCGIVDAAKVPRECRRGSIILSRHISFGGRSLPGNGYTEKYHLKGGSTVL